MRKNKDHKRFLIYSAYAWGFPVAMTCLTFSVDTYKFAPAILWPEMGHANCWFRQKDSSIAYIVFFLIPIGLQIFSNVVLFIMTLVYCNKVKSEINRMQDNVGDADMKRFSVDKAKYVTYILTLVKSI